MRRSNVFGDRRTMMKSSSRIDAYSHGGRAMQNKVIPSRAVDLGLLVIAFVIALGIGSLTGAVPESIPRIRITAVQEVEGISGPCWVVRYSVNGIASSEYFDTEDHAKGYISYLKKIGKME